MLALQANMHSSSEHYELGEDSGTRTVDGSHDEGTPVAEHQFHETSGVEQETKLFHRSYYHKQHPRLLPFREHGNSHIAKWYNFLCSRDGFLQERSRQRRNRA